MKVIKSFVLLIPLSLLLFLGACTQQETQPLEGNQEAEEQVEEDGEDVEEDEGEEEDDG
jgi:outer membrane lipoprotein-sorting protein